MLAAARILMLGMITLCLTGCALWSQETTPVRPPLTKEQADWWTANQHKKKFVAGRGYYIEGTSGFFDHDGHRVSSDLTGSAHVEQPGVLAALAPKNVADKTKKLVGRGPDESIARQAMAEGDALFRQKEYKKAADAFRTAYKRWPDSPLEEECLFKAAESEFFGDRYSKSEDEYELLIKKFPATQYLSQVTIRRFAIGRYWEQHDRAHPAFVLQPNVFDKTRPKFDTGGHALRVYEKIRMDDPIGPLADDAVMATANAYFLKGRWDDADYHYGLLRSEFPKSEHQFQAHLLGLRCKLLRYQGPGYEGSQLDEAEDIASQLLTQFPQELGSERERVAQVRAEVHSQRALREWDMAEFYAKNEYYGAAKHYLTKVSKDFPDTKLAEQANVKLAEYKALPDNPDPPFEWIANLLPESKKNGPSLPKNLQPVAPVTSADTPQNVANGDDESQYR